MTLTDEHHCAGTPRVFARARTARQSFNEARGRAAKKTSRIGIGAHSIPFARCVAYIHAYTDSFAYMRECVYATIPSTYAHTHPHTRAIGSDA